MEKSILFHNKKIFYRSTGSGKPVVLIHGFGETGDVWKHQSEVLMDKFHLIIPDLPGSGKSEMIDDMSMEGMTGMIKVIIDKECSEAPSFGEGLEEVCLVGHSMGGYVTLAFAEKYPEYLSAFGLFHSTAFADSEEKKEIRRKGIEFIRRHGAFEFLQTTTPNLFSPNSKSEIPDAINEFIESLKDFSADALIAYYQAMIQRPDRTAVLKNSKIPILFIAGEYDNAVPLNDSLKQCHLSEKCYFHVLKKSGHMGMFEQPGDANRILDEFLQDT
jgi:pimeloyl-ACP methyl ester carboxylesterase